MVDRRDHLTPGYSIDQMADELYLALHQLKISGADIVGASEGGMIAQKLIIDHPDIVHKLVLAVTFSAPNKTSALTIKHWINLAQKRRLKELVWDSLQRSYSAQAILNFNVKDQLTRVKCPTLVIGAQQDQVLSVEGAKTTAKLLHAPLYVYPQYGHAVYLEAKDFMLSW